MLRRLLSISTILALATQGYSAELAPHLKALLCTGDFGMYGQDRVPLITKAVEQASPGSAVSWEVHQSYNLCRSLESASYAKRFDVIVIGDVGMGQLTTQAQRSLVEFVKQGGGLVWVLQGKAGLPFHDVEEAVPMPLKDILPIAYPDFGKPHPDAQVIASSDALFAGIDWAPLTNEGAVKSLPQMLRIRAVGPGMVIGMADAYSMPLKYVSYATYEKLHGGWNEFPALGEVWARVLEKAASHSPVRSKSRAEVDAAFTTAPLLASLTVDTGKQIDDIRAADFSIVALQQLYNEDGGKNEALFLALNPLDWFDRRSQEVLPGKSALFTKYNIKGIYMGDNSYGSYGNWDDAKYTEQIAKAIADKQKSPTQLAFFQAGNEPPLDQNYVTFHNRFVGGVLKGAPEYQVIGPNKAFNILGVDAKEMQFYIDQCGATTDILNWHTYAQPPSTVVAEARYWSGKATGKLRTPGPAKVMFTESDAWNTGDSQFNYLMDRALMMLPEPLIIGNFQYCMDSRNEGGPYHFGILQPEGTFSANYNGYWVWRNLRGRMVDGKLTTAKPQDSLRAITSISRDGATVTTVAYFGTPLWADGTHADHATLTIDMKLPPGTWKLAKSEVDANKRTEVPPASATVTGDTKVTVEFAPYQAVALTWTKQ